METLKTVFFDKVHNIWLHSYHILYRRTINCHPLNKYADFFQRRSKLNKCKYLSLVVIDNMNPIFVIYILRLCKPSVIEEWLHAFYKWYMTHCWSLFYVSHYVANFFHVILYMLPKICITWYIECTYIVWILKVFIALKTHHKTIKN